MLDAVLDWPTLRSWGESLIAMNLLDSITLGILAYGGWKVFIGRPLRVLTKGRRRSLEPLGVPTSAVRARVARLARGADPTPAEELSWLSSVLAERWDVATTFAEPDRRVAIAQAYESYAARLETGALLGANHSPLVRSEARRARSVASLARSYTRLSSSVDGIERGGIVPVELRLDVPHRGLALTMHGAGKQGQGPLHAHDLVISYRASRYFVNDQTHRDQRDRFLPVSDQEKTSLKEYFALPHRFDGSLPRLVDWAADADARSGRVMLHLSVAETTFGAVVADHYPLELRASPTDDARDVSGGRVRVLTLSAVLVTRCGHLVFVKRSKMSGSHQGKLGPAGNGNLEFDARPGLDSDFDSNGLPDFRRALARELREEIGVVVDPRDVHVTGLGHFAEPTERGTYVLLGVCFVDMDRDDVLSSMQRSDPIEGQWENEETLVTLRLPRTDGERAAAVDWLVNENKLTPHATMAGLGALVVALRTDSFLADVESYVRGGPVDKWPPVLRDMLAQCHAGGTWQSFIGQSRWRRVPRSWRSVHFSASAAPRQRGRVLP